MGPFDLKRQQQRIASCDSLLAQPNLAPGARALWTRIRNNITLDEDEYNRRVAHTYRGLTKEQVLWNP